MHDRISIHHIAFPTQDVAVLGQHFAAVGARRVSLWSGLLAQSGIPAIKAMLARGNYSVETVPHIFRQGALTSDPKAMAEDRGRLSQAIADAAAVGARSIYMLTGGRGDMEWREAATAFAAAIAPCLPQAREAGVALSVETTTPFYAHLHLGTNLRDAISLAEIAEIGLCLDYFGCWTESDVYDQVRQALPRTTLVQVSDYVLGDTSLPCRAVPGDGTIPWPRVLKTLLDGGYAGNFDLELIGPRIDAEGHETAVHRAADRLGAMLVALGA